MTRVFVMAIALIFSSLPRWSPEPTGSWRAIRRSRRSIRPMRLPKWLTHHFCVCGKHDVEADTYSCLIALVGVHRVRQPRREHKKGAVLYRHDRLRMSPMISHAPLFCHPPTERKLPYSNWWRKASLMGNYWIIMVAGMRNRRRLGPLEWLGSTKPSLKRLTSSACFRRLCGKPNSNRSFC